MSKLIKLIDSMLDTISRPLASSLSKSGIVKYGQAFRDKSVDEERAIQNVFNFLVGGAAYTTICFQVSGFCDRLKQRSFVAEQELEQFHQEFLKRSEEIEQGYRKLMDEF